MRAQSLLHNLLGLEETRVLKLDFDAGGLVVTVAPQWRKPRCSECGQPGPGYDCDHGRQWRHLDLGGVMLHLCYDIRRVRCRDCGVKVERVPWAETSSKFTRAFEDHVGYLAQRCDKTTVSALMRIAWSTVGAIVQRVVARHGSAHLLDELTHIGSMSCPIGAITNT